VRACIVRKCFSPQFLATERLHIGYNACRVRAIFELPDVLRNTCPEKLVYVELFNNFSERPLYNIGLFTTSHSLHDGRRVAAVLRLADVHMACHLAPRYSTFHPERSLTLRSDVLDLCRTFFFNIFSSYFIFELMRHWNQDGGPGGVND
jgi:hypothetical protein